MDLVGRDAEYYLKLRWRVPENRNAPAPAAMPASPSDFTEVEMT